MPKKRPELAIYPGTFDPITLGHCDLVDRAQKIFDRIIIAVAASASKHPLFTLEERMDMIRRIYKPKNSRIIVKSFDGLVVRFARREGAPVLLRGVRMLSDFEYEFQMALTNRKLDSGIETLYLMPNESYAYITSRMIKEVALMGGDTRNFVPPYVQRCLAKKLRSSHEIFSR